MDIGILIYLIGCLMSLAISIYYLVTAYKEGSVTLGQLTVFFLMVLASYMGVFVVLLCYIVDHWDDDVIENKKKK